jgi:hypothetical protein
VNARGLYNRLRYELAPMAVTTMGPCSEGCGGSARGSGVCVACLSAKLQSAVPEVEWDGFVEALRVSRDYILSAEAEIFR